MEWCCSIHWQETRIICNYYHNLWIMLIVSNVANLGKEIAELIVLVAEFLMMPEFVHFPLSWSYCYWHDKTTILPESLLTAWLGRSVMVRWQLDGLFWWPRMIKEAFSWPLLVIPGREDRQEGGMGAGQVCGSFPAKNTQTDQPCQSTTDKLLKI